MMRARVYGGLIVLAGLQLSGVAQQPLGGRPLAIEDYYRIQTVGSPAISPNGRWVAFTVATRIEDDNSTRTETFVVAADGSGQPTRVVYYGKDVTIPSWSGKSRLESGAERQRWTIDPSNPSDAPVNAVGMPAAAVLSADGKSIAFAKEKPQPKRERVYASEFERRHEERFKGVTFDWKDFQRDGAPFPAPNLHARPASQLVVQTVGADADDVRVLVDQDLRPSDIAWRPDGKQLAFTADPDWRDELKYGNAQLFTVTIDRIVTRLTTDGYVYGGVDFSPDSRHLAYVRSFGTGMIVEQKLNHGVAAVLQKQR